jgi:hypothetical protein
VNERKTPGHALLTTIARAALVFALVAAVWTVYRTLPEELESSRSRSTTLRVFLRRATINFPIDEGKLAVELYPINVAAARNEFESERRPGVRFDDFLLRLMGDRQPVKAELDESGEASVNVSPGRWWVHAQVRGEQDLTWRLPVNVTGREVTVDLTYENAYLRAKRF